MFYFPMTGFFLLFVGYCSFVSGHRRGGVGGGCFDKKCTNYETISREQPVHFNNRLNYCLEIGETSNYKFHSPEPAVACVLLPRTTKRATCATDHPTRKVLLSLNAALRIQFCA